MMGIEKSSSTKAVKLLSMASFTDPRSMDRAHPSTNMTPVMKIGWRSGLPRHESNFRPRGPRQGTASSPVRICSQSRCLALGRSTKFAKILSLWMGLVGWFYMAIVARSPPSPLPLPRKILWAGGTLPGFSAVVRWRGIPIPQRRGITSGSLQTIVQDHSLRRTKA